MSGDDAARTALVGDLGRLAARFVGHVLEFLVTCAAVVLLPSTPLVMRVAANGWCSVAPDYAQTYGGTAELALFLLGVPLDALLAVVAWLAVPHPWRRRAWTGGLLAASLAVSVVAEYRTGLPLTDRCAPGRGPWWWPVAVPWLT